MDSRTAHRLHRTKSIYTLYRITFVQSIVGGLFTYLAFKHPHINLIAIASILMGTAIVVSLLSVGKISSHKFLRLTSYLGFLVYFVCFVFFGHTTQFSTFSFPFSQLYRILALPPWFFLSLLLLFAHLETIQAITYDLYAEHFQKKHTILPLILVTILLSQLLQVGSQMVMQGSQTLTLLNAPRIERYAQRSYGIGNAGWFYRVGAFWDEHIPKSKESVVAIPPQGDPWIQSGNIYYVLSFLYPRQVYMVQKSSSKIPSHVTHIVIARGESDIGKHGWPTWEIPSISIEKITTYNPFSDEIRTFSSISYIPELYTDVYGVITLKK